MTIRERLSTPETYHYRNHRLVLISECWDCGRARAKCRAKVRYADPRAASEDADRINAERAYDSPLRRYRCPWCEGWHLTKKPGHKGARKRVEKRRRRWRIAEVNGSGVAPGESADVALSIAADTFTARAAASSEGSETGRG